MTWTSSEVTTFVLQRAPLRKGNKIYRNGRIYLQIIYLIRDLYLDYMKNSYNSIIKDIHYLNRNFSKEYKQIRPDKKFSIISHYGNAH